MPEYQRKNGGAMLQPDIADLLRRSQALVVRDSISRPQMESYVAFLGDQPLQHPLMAGVLGEYDRVMWERIARDGKSALGEKSGEVDRAYIAMWEEWQETQPNRPPRSHIWLKGVVAAALAIADTRLVRGEGSIMDRRRINLLSPDDAEAEIRRVLNPRGGKDNVALKHIDYYRECWEDPQIRALVPADFADQSHA
jgi:hypothetical protein